MFSAIWDKFWVKDEILKRRADMMPGEVVL